MGLGWVELGQVLVQVYSRVTHSTRVTQGTGLLWGFPRLLNHDPVPAELQTEI